MSSKYKIIIHKYEEREIYDEALKKLCFVITGAFNQKKKVLIFLSGGSSVNLYTKLAGWIAVKKDIGGNLAFAQVDERFQPGDQVSGVRYQVSGGKKNNNINAEVIGESGLWRICDSKKVPYYLVSQEGSLEVAADGYNKIISDLFEKYDYKIAILGIGEDGHTAGLLPGYQKKWDKGRLVVGYDNQGKFKKRISLTPQGLIQLDYALIVVSGDKKKEAVKNILDKNNYNKINFFPAVILQKIPNVDLFTDNFLGIHLTRK